MTSTPTSPTNTGARTGGLPSSLAPWAETLGPLDASLALALGPLLRILDELIGRLDVAHGDLGDVDGYDGTTVRGDPERLLLSEWALADEVPLEFLRRAAENELQYLHRAHRNSRAIGRVVIACDTGPDQIGPGRLLQLAALVVLLQRASRIGAEVEVRILQTGEQVEGDIVQIAERWLRARSVSRPSSDQCQRVVDEVDASHDVWFLLGNQKCAPAGHRRVLSSQIVSWSSVGASELLVRVGNATATVALPGGDAGVAALRGEGLHARQRTAVGTVLPGARGATFLSADHRLLWRGERDDELQSCRVGPGVKPKIKTHRLGGRVLAAAFLGRRLVAAVTDGRTVRVRVVGKKVAHVERIDVLLSDLGLDEAVVDARMQAALRPLYLSGGGSVLLGGATGWWSLSDQEPPSQEGRITLAPGPALDAPRRAINTNGLWVNDFQVRHRSAAAVVFGPVQGRLSWYAWSDDLRVWTVCSGRRSVATIGVPEGDTVIGLLLLPRPSLVTVSPAGILVRHYTQDDTYTWTRFSGSGDYAVHPAQPWLVSTTAEKIVVADLHANQILLELRTTP